MEDLGTLNLAITAYLEMERLMEYLETSDLTNTEYPSSAGIGASHEGLTSRKFGSDQHRIPPLPQSQNQTFFL